MVRLALVALVLVLVLPVGCTQPPPELPWLHGTEISALSTSVLPGRNPDDTANPCGDGAFDHIELAADLTADPGVETLRASAAQGVQVHAASGVLVAQAIAEPCEAVDHIRALAVASGMVLVVDARGTTTQVTVLRPNAARRHLERVYAGVVEHGRGDDRRIGTLALVGDRLVHTDPDGVTTVRLVGTRP